MDAAAAMARVAADTEDELERLLRDVPDVPAELLAAMRHATLAAGKRFRPFLVYAAAALGQGDPAATVRVGAAIELIHCYSLVHDDLPAMDDADLRRGRPACHKLFGEAVAILAGDALTALAFEALAAPDWPADAEMRVALIAGLARASGMAGMCGGQTRDIATSGTGVMAETALTLLQRQKTGALIAFALDAGAAVGRLDAAARRALGAYAAALGLAFQIRDDVLDVAAVPAATGKAPGRDAALGRATFVTLLGVDGATARLAALRTEGVGALDDAGLETALLGDLFDFVISRRS